MFTGIVEEKGKVRYIQLTGESGILAVKARKVLEGTRIGDSIAVNGVCLTVTSIQPDGFTADVMAETIRRSSLGSCKAGSQVNLERAMAADGRFGGHIVSGHIDGTGVIRSMLREENAIWVSIETSPQILHLIVEKGSVCIDGISLTVARVDEAGFQVSVIPHTGEETTLLEKVPGDLVNLENDVIGKYVEKLMGIGKKEESKLEHEKKTGITTLFITHDQQEALAISDKIAVMRDGEVLQVGEPEEIYNRPNQEFVANFVGVSNRVMREDYVALGIEKYIDRPDIFVRPEEFVLGAQENQGISGRITEVRFGGMYYDYTIQAKTHTYRVVQMNEGAGMKVWQVDDCVCLQLKNKDGVVKRYEQ